MFFLQENEEDLCLNLKILILKFFKFKNFDLLIFDILID